MKSSGWNITVTVTSPAASPALATTVVSPALTPVTRPVSSTVATDSSSLDHSTSGSGIRKPLASETSAASWMEAPSATSGSTGVTSTVAGSWRTSTVTDPLRPDA